MRNSRYTVKSNCVTYLPTFNRAEGAEGDDYGDSRELHLAMTSKGVLLTVVSQCSIIEQRKATLLKVTFVLCTKKVSIGVWCLF